MNKYQVEITLEDGEALKSESGKFVVVIDGNCLEAPENKFTLNVEAPSKSEAFKQGVLKGAGMTRGVVSVTVIGELDEKKDEQV